MPSIRVRPDSDGPASKETSLTTDQLIDNLLASGMSPTNLARVSGIPLDNLLNRKIAPVEYIPDENDISREVALFTGKVITEAHNMLDSASPVTKLRLMAIILPKLVAQLGKTQPKEMEDLRNNLLALFTSLPEGNLSVPALDETD